MVIQYQKVDDCLQKLKYMSSSSKDFLSMIDYLIGTVREEYNKIESKVSEIEAQYMECIRELEQNLRQLPQHSLKNMGKVIEELHKYGQSKGIFKIMENYEKTKKISYSDYNKLKDYTKESLVVLAITGGIHILAWAGTWFWKKKKEKEMRQKIAEYISTHNALLKANINSLREIRQVCKKQKADFEFLLNQKIPQNDEKLLPIRKRISETIQIMNDAIYKIDRFLNDPIVELIK